MTFDSLLVQIPLNIMLVVGIPLAFIYFFSKLDEEFSESLRIKTSNIAIIIIVSILYIIASAILLSNNAILWLNTSLMTGYLIFCSYTDLKTKLLYSSVSLAFLGIELTLLLIDYKAVPFNKYSWTILVVILAMYLMSIPRWIGLGDVFIYAVIATYLTHYRFIPTVSIVMNLLFTNIMFVIATIIIKGIKHDKEKHQPLTVFIAISTVCCCLLGI